MNLKARLAEIKQELRALQNTVLTAKDEELDGIQEKMTKLETEMTSIRKKIEMENKAKRMVMGIPEDEEEEEEPEAETDKEEAAVRTIATDGATEKRAAEKTEKRRKMGADLIKGRTVILDETVLIPKKQSETLAPYPFNQVSSVLDAVSYISVINGETYEAPYLTGNGEGDYTDQPVKAGTGGVYKETSPTWNTATISKTKITAYGEITKELERTPVANYANAVEQNITISLRKKLAREIVAGDGGTGHFVGIMSAKLNSATGAEVDTVVDYKLGEINENTLDEIVLNYGGDEDIESTMAFLMNKLTLLAFSRVRGSDKRKVYNIDYTNYTIDGIKFFTSSHIKSFDAATAGVEATAGGRGDGFLAYGDFSKYNVAVFSNIETAKSTDFKFSQGITAYRGDVFMGGNVVGYKAFMRVFKGASTVKTLTAIPVTAGMSALAMKAKL